MTQTGADHHESFSPQTVCPLCVDLDGTLTVTDTLSESLLMLIRRQPLYLFALSFWFCFGRAYFKQQVALHQALDASRLPYRESLLTYLRQQKQVGRTIILTTASDRRTAQAVSDHLKLFDAVIASDGAVNCIGENKVRAIRETLQTQAFDYIGDSYRDLPVWREAQQAMVAAPSAGLLKALRSIREPVQVFDASVAGGRVVGLIKGLRPMHWTKNLLLAIPLLMGHIVTPATIWWSLFCAMASFSLCASAVYIINDLFDLDSDRRHPHKCKRPFASGQTPIHCGVLAAAACMAASFLLATICLPAGFVIMLSLYLMLTSAYTLALKRVMILDAIMLASLYSLRLVAGGVAVSSDTVNVMPSSWLLAFSMFFFVCLAFAKRYSELRRLRLEDAAHAHGRGYRVSDIEVVSQIGLTSGFLSVLVFILYATDPGSEVRRLYHQPTVLLLVSPVLFYWIARLWLLARRGELDEDPVVFTLTDGVSYACGGVLVMLLWLAGAQFV